MKKTITKPEVKVMKLQKMNVIATSGGDTSYAPAMAAKGLDNGGNTNWYKKKY